MKKIAIAALLSAFVAAPAVAADNGFYAGVSLGQARSKSPVPGVPMSKTNDTVYGVLAGYQFTKNWGVEGFFTGAGKWQSPVLAGVGINGKADTYGLVGTGTLPLSDTFSLYGKLGYASTKTTSTGTALGLAASFGATRAAATYGVGVQYNVTPAIGIRAGWDRYGAAITNFVAIGAKSNYNVDAYTVAAVFKF